MVTPATAPKFEDLTETTGLPLSPEGASMMFTRYAAAASLTANRRVLELGCGAGQGFTLLRRAATSLVGADYSAALLDSARRHFAGVPLVRLSADALPFRPDSFDLVLCFEMSYYVPDMRRAFDDLARIVAPGGQVMFVNANPERSDFIRSPHSVHYHSADEFRAALTERGFDVGVSGAYPVDPPATGLKETVAKTVFSAARQVMEALGLVPKTLKGRARIKRLIHRKLITVPAELSDGFAEKGVLTELGSGRQAGYKVIYVLGTRRT
jgi:SAM-dependent methyltransferase